MNTSPFGRSAAGSKPTESASESGRAPVFGRSIAILAVGTEVVEGQILDRNSAWLAQECVAMGFTISSHRAVGDDRARIRRALDDLRAEAPTVFVTGGLGPTSDDFTRELIADSFAEPLEFDDQSWLQVQAKLAARGIQAREIQKQQCWYPRGAQVLPNSAGTANGFRLVKGTSRLYAFPGPPSEVAVVFDDSVRAELQNEIPEMERVDLRIWRCLGRGESDLAEIAEKALAGSGMAVGYRAHLPYVEVKVWVPRAQAVLKRRWLDALDEGLAAWVVNRDDEDVADPVLEAARHFPEGLRIIDAATDGFLLERLATRARSLNRDGSAAPAVLDIDTVLGGGEVKLAELDARAFSATAQARPTVLIAVREVDRVWAVAWRFAYGAPIQRHDVRPPFIYKFGSERARKFICERALRLLGQALASRQSEFE